jgi:hypothetical protein
MDNKSVLLKSGKKKEYSIEKKSEYNFNDYKEIIDHFNEKLVEFMEELYKICKEKRWRKESDEIGSYIEAIMLGVKSNKLIAIHHFSLKIYPYYNFIKTKNEQVLLQTDYNDAVSGAADGVSKIMKVKKLWLESGDENREYIFSALEYLCYCIEHYEEVGLTTDYVKKPTGVIPIK